MAVQSYVSRVPEYVGRRWYGPGTVFLADDSVAPARWTLANAADLAQAANDANRPGPSSGGAGSYLGAIIKTFIPDYASGGGTTPVPVLPTYFDYTKQAIPFAAANQRADLDYENDRFYVNGVTYASYAAAVAAGACVPGSAKGVGDRWALGANFGVTGFRFVGTMGPTAPTLDAYVFAVDNGADGNATDEMVGLLWTTTPAMTLANTSGGTFLTGSPANTRGVPANSEVVVSGTIAGGTGNGRLQVTAGGGSTYIQSNPASRATTLNSLIVGQRLDGRAFGGVTKRLTVWNASFSQDQVTYLSKEAQLGTSIGSVITGFINPTAVQIGTKLYLPGYQPADHFAVEVDASGGANNGAVTGYARLSTQTSMVDDHCKPAVSETANGLLFAYTGHQQNQTFRTRRATAKNLSALAAEVATDASVSGPATAYAQVYRQASTGNMFCLFRQHVASEGTGYQWSWMKSTDEGATWTAPKNLVQNVEQFYFNAMWVDTDRLMFVCGENPRNGPPSARAFTWNVTTGDIASLTGVIANSGSLAQTVGIDFTSLPVFAAGFGAPSVGNSNAAVPVMILGTAYRRYSGSGNVLDPANWSTSNDINVIAPPGTAGGVNADWSGGACISNLASLTTPRIFRAIHEGAFWKLVQLDATDAAGTNFVRTKTIRQASDANYNMVHRPFSPLGCTADLEVVWCEGRYYDFNEAATVAAMRLTWKRDA